MSTTLRSTLMENAWFSTEPYQIPKIWPHIPVPRCRKPFGQPLWKIHGFPENLWFSTEPYQISRIWPHIRVPRCRKLFGQPLWKMLGFPKNLWFSIEPYQIPRIWPHIRVPRCRKPFGQPLRGPSWYLSKSMIFDLCGHTSNQSIRQFFFLWLFSTRKRIKHFHFTDLFYISRLFFSFSLCFMFVILLLSIRDVRGMKFWCLAGPVP